MLQLHAICFLLKLLQFSSLYPLNSKTIKRFFFQKCTQVISPSEKWKEKHTIIPLKIVFCYNYRYQLYILFSLDRLNQPKAERGMGKFREMHLQCVRRDFFFRFVYTCSFFVKPRDMHCFKTRISFSENRLSSHNDTNRI